jgi:hypothetical protein
LHLHLQCRYRRPQQAPFGAVYLLVRSCQFIYTLTSAL